MTTLALDHGAGTGGAITRPAAEAASPAQSRSLLYRIAQAFEAAQRRRIDREVARIIQLNGGYLSDDVERKLARLFRA